MIETGLGPQKTCVTGFGLLRKFGGNRQGTVAVVAALCVLPLLIIGAGGLDYARASRVRSALQSATDAAALAAARLGEVDAAEINAVANRFMAANAGPVSDVQGLSLSISKTTTGVKIVADGYVNPHFLKMIGVDRLGVGVTSEAETDPGDLEIALALDNTGSMRPYMADLRTAASDLVNTIFDATRNSTKLRIAIVSVCRRGQYRQWRPAARLDGQQRRRAVARRGVRMAVGCHTEWLRDVARRRRWWRRRTWHRHGRDRPIRRVATAGAQFRGFSARSRGDIDGKGQRPHGAFGLHHDHVARLPVPGQSGESLNRLICSTEFAIPRGRGVSNPGPSPTT